MNLDLLMVLIFLLVLVVLFWVMNDKSASRVTNSMSSLLRVLPISKIAKAISDYFKNMKNNGK